MANLKATLLFALVATCLAVKPPGYVEKPAPYDESPPRYAFEYEVKDAEGGSQGHTEVRRGVYAVGGFYTRLPGENGAQRVSYYADDWGFHPVLVAYGGHGYNTRIAFGDKAVATANAASGATGIQGINAIGVNIPHSVNPLPDLTQTGAAALAAEAPQIPDAAQLVASVGQPPAPPQPPKTVLTPAGTTILSSAPQYSKPVQPVIQQHIRPAVPLVHYQQRPRLPLPSVQVAPVRPVVPVAPVIPTSYPKYQPISPVSLGVTGASGPSPTSFVSTVVPVKAPAVVSQPAVPVVSVVSTTPAPATIVSHAIHSVPTGGAFIHGISGPATSFVSSGAQTVSKAPVVVPTYQTFDTSIGGGVNSLKESSAAAAAAAASALSAAAASGGLKEASIGQGVSYSQQTSNVGLGAVVSSGSVLGSGGHAQQAQGGQLISFGGQYSQGGEGGYHYERPVGGLSYRPIISGVTDKGVGGVVSQTFQYSPYVTTGYQSGFTYSPGYQTVYTEGPQISYQTGTTASSFSQSSSSSQGSSVFGGEGGGFFITTKEPAARPQGGTSFQTHIDHGQSIPSLPTPTVSQGIGSGFNTIGFTQQETYVTTPAPPVTVTESITVTPRPTRPIIVAELPKATPTFSPAVETSTPAPPPSSTLTTAISSSTIASPAPSTIEVTTPTPLTSSTPLTPFYSTFPANSPCIVCQSTRSQEVTLLTAPASESTSTTLDSELQQIFFPDSTPSIEVGGKEGNFITETVDVTPTPFSLEERGGPVTTSQPTVSVKVLNEDRGTTSSLFESAISAEGFSAQREGGGQFSFSDGNAHLFGGSGSGQAFGGQANEFASFNGGGSQFVSGGSGGKSQTLSGGAVQAGQHFSGHSGSSEFNRIASGGSEYYNEGGYSGGGGIISVTSTPAPPVSVSLGVTPSPSPSVLYVDRPVAVPIPYAVPQLVPYAVKGSSASSYKDRHSHRTSSSSSGSSSETYESSTPSVISVTQITKIRTSGRKNADRGYVKQVVEESGSSEEEEEEEEFIVRGGSVKLASGRFGSQGSYSRGRLPPPPFRSASLKSEGNYGDRIRVERPRKLCIEYGGFKPPLVPSDPDYNQSINLR